ncbi:peptidylprolyl isomerase [Geopsychrobacter electrodiphilus]|uniref:peptidylprolyl isomerase n=1 Tax=Geopsychrobacter electrodiphilus TaxID=225196 RepID=UPI0003642161|nr:peptidylprolyl isomerase [Geopsychrobacter electrodiphilus]
MLRNFCHLVSALILVAATSVCGFAFGGGGQAADTKVPSVPVELKELTVPLRARGEMVVRNIPLFSAKYADTPVAMVNDEPITMAKFAMTLANMHNQMAGSEAAGKQDYFKALDRLIQVKLVEQEALNIGFDRTPEVRAQMDSFALTTLIQQLLAQQVLDVKLDEKEIDALYQKMAIETKLLTYKFNEKPDAEAFLKAYRAGGDFKILADQQVSSGKAAGGENSDYMKLIDLFPSVAKAAFSMKKGEVSDIFQAEKGFLIFRLEDKKVYDDPQVRDQAANTLFQQKSREKQMKYLKSLVRKYAKTDEKVMTSFDFGKIMSKKPQAKGTEIFAQLKEDKRPLATITDGKEKVTITVAEVAKELEASMFHGTNITLDAKKMDNQKDDLIYNKEVAVAGRMEAQRQGIDKQKNYIAAVEENKERLLFEAFVNKAVVPGLTVRDEDARKYYFNNLETYASPMMLKMKSLIFNDKARAEDALRKLKAGSDFKWVSSNATGLADTTDKNILTFDGNLLAATALPEDLQKLVGQAKQGDYYLYAGPDQLFYTLQVESVYPSVAKPYEEVRQEVGRILYGQKINDALADWVTKLKAAYETESFLVQK